MRLHVWMFVALIVLLGGTLAWAQAADNKPAADAAATGLLATGALGGLWKGIVTGVGRAVVGFFSKPTGTSFDFPSMLATALAGAIAGVLMGVMNVPFDQAVGWLATVGATELIAKLVKGLWNRWAGAQVGETVARAMARSPRG